MRCGMVMAGLPVKRPPQSMVLLGLDSDMVGFWGEKLYCNGLNGFRSRAWGLSSLQ